jgi:uncharacterized damage-inducible protein DinB
MEPILATFYRHNLWANERMLEACANLTDAQLDAGVDGTRGSIRETLMHLVGAEERYVGALTGAYPDQSWVQAGWQGTAPLIERVRASGEALISIAREVAPGTILRTRYRGEDHEVPVETVLIQVINHATEHRSQIATILTQQGIEPPNLDGWSYGAMLGTTR